MLRKNVRVWLLLGLIYHPVEIPGKHSCGRKMCVRIYFVVTHVAIERRFAITISLHSHDVNMRKALQCRMLYLYDNLHEAVLLPKGTKLQTNSCKCGKRNSDFRTSSTSVYCCPLLLKILTTANFECQHTYDKIGLSLKHKMGEKRNSYALKV